MKHVQFRKFAAEGQVYTLTAFDRQIGRTVPMMTDEGVADAKVIAAEVDVRDGCRSALLTFEVPDEVGEFLSDQDALYAVGIHGPDRDLSFRGEQAEARPMQADRLSVEFRAPEGKRYDLEPFKAQTGHRVPLLGSDGQAYSAELLGVAYGYNDLRTLVFWLQSTRDLVARVQSGELTLRMGLDV
jgi:hypothetical protein